MRQTPSPRPVETEWTPRRVGLCADRLFLYCFLAYTCSYLSRKNLSACVPAMIAEGLIHKTGAGYITTAHMIAYGVGQLLSGIAASRVGPQYLIGLGLFGAGACNIGMSMADNALLFPVIWALNGLFQSMLWSPIIRTFTDRLPPGRREKAGVRIAISCSLGAILAYLFPALLLQLAGWRTVFLAAGLITLAIFLVWVVGHYFLRAYIHRMDNLCHAERVAPAARTETEKGTDIPPRRRSLPAVFILSGMWLMLPALFCSGALQDAVETWAPTFLAEQFGLADSLAALFTVLIPIFSLLGPFASDTLHKRVFRNEIYTCGLLFAVALACIGGMFLSSAVNALLCAFFMATGVAAMFGTNHMFLTVVPYHFAPIGLSATVSGFLNSAIYFASALFSSVYGLIAENHGWNVLILVWLCVSAAGILLSLLGGRLWQRKHKLVDEGRL